MTNYQKQCEDIYYASDVCDKTLSFGCLVEGTQYIWTAEDDSRPHDFATKIIQVVPKGTDGGCLYYGIGNYELTRDDITKIIGRPPKLSDWLSLLFPLGVELHHTNTQLIVVSNPKFPLEVKFDLKNGQPQTEEEWRNLLEIIK